MKRILLFGLMAVTAFGAQAAVLAPTAVGDAAVGTALEGRSNLALSSGGAQAFSSSDLTPDYAAPRVNDGVIDHSGNSWIPASTDANEFVAVQLAEPATIAAVVWHGQTGYDGRSGGTYSLQYTTDAEPSGASDWTEIGTYTYVEAGCASPMPRSLFAFPAVPGVTALRLTQSTTCSAPWAIQEFEAFAPVSDPPQIVAHPSGATLVAGSDFTFSVTATGAESQRWRKNGENISGATGSSFTLSDVKVSDAGEYTVEVSNAAGSVISDPAVLEVNPAPVFASYAEAILTDNPIHYYPLDETEGTVAEDLGTLALAGGTLTGGVTPGAPAATPLLGRSARFDGQSGSLIDLGLFHAGDAITVEAWVNLDTDARSASYHAAVARWDGSFELDFATDDRANLVVRRDGNGFGIAAGTTPATRGQWHHLVGVFGNGVVTVYVNGVKGSEQNIGGVLQNAGPSPDRVMIGATREGVFNFKGSIDEVAIYDYALSAAQIRGHYRTAFPSEAPELTIEKAVLLSWPVFPPDFVLQGAEDVEGPYVNVTGSPVIEDNMFKLAIPSNEAHQFYRLFKE